MTSINPPPKARDLVHKWTFRTVLTIPSRVGIIAMSLGMVQPFLAVPRNDGDGFTQGGGFLQTGCLCRHMVMRRIPARACVRAGSKLARVES